MTADVLAAPEARPLPLPVALGLREGWRIVRHPIALLGFALMTVLVVAIGDNGPRDAFEVVSTGPTFCYGVFTYFAAHLVASRDHRAHSGELLAAVPSSRSQRVAALCVAALLPTAMSAAFVVVAHTSHQMRGLYVVEPDLWHLAQGPVTVLGAALLGTMVARLTRVPGTSLLVMVGMFAWNIWISNHPAEIQPLGTYVSWALWAPHPGWAGMAAGSPAWHVAYLLCLCAMAACGAFLREATRTGRVLGLGAALTALMLVPATLQLR